jgi:hypothetical protein
MNTVTMCSNDVATRRIVHYVHKFVLIVKIFEIVENYHRNLYKYTLIAGIYFNIYTLICKFVLITNSSFQNFSPK